MLDILFILKYKNNYYKYIKYITHYSVPTETWTVLKDMKEWFEDDATREVVDWREFAEWFRLVKHPLMRAEQHELYEKLFTELADYTGDLTTTTTIIDRLIAREYGSRIADVALKVADGDPKNNLDDVTVAMDEYYHQVGSAHEDVSVSSLSLSDIVEELEHGDGLKWRLHGLNMSCGPLRKNDLVIIAARPETGKTSFLTSEATYMATQLTKPVLWFNNEQSRSAVWQRIYTTALGVPYSELKKDPLTYMEEYDRIVGKDKVILIDKADLTVSEIEKYCREYQPGLIVIDQLWKVHGYENIGNSAQVQGALFKKARQWAKDYAPLLAAHQADGGAEGIRWIEKNQLYESKTAVVGEADVIITIGMIHDPGYETSRFLYVPKNKLPTPGDEKMRHGRWEVEMELETGRFK